MSLTLFEVGATVDPPRDEETETWQSEWVVTITHSGTRTGL